MRLERGARSSSDSVVRAGNPRGERAATLCKPARRSPSPRAVAIEPWPGGQGNQRPPGRRGRPPSTSGPGHPRTDANGSHTRRTPDRRPEHPVRMTVRSKCRGFQPERRQARLVPPCPPSSSRHPRPRIQRPRPSGSMTRRAGCNSTIRATRPSEPGPRGFGLQRNQPRLESDRATSILTPIQAHNFKQCKVFMPGASDSSCRSRTTALRPRPWWREAPCPRPLRRRPPTSTRSTARGRADRGQRP